MWSTPKPPKAPMPRPEAPQLEAQAQAPVSGLKAHPLGASACLVAGIAVVVAMALLLGQDSLHSVDLRFVIPISSISIILSIAALVRREPGFTLPAIAIALAEMAMNKAMRMVESL